MESALQYLPRSGFTLHETSMALAVLALLTAVAVPPFSSFIEEHRHRVVRDQLVAHIHFARAQAVANRRSHRLCGSSDGLVCDGNWSRYWLVSDASDKLIRRFRLSREAALCWIGFTQESLVFRENGTSPVSNGRFTLCRFGQPVWQLVLNRQGRLRISAVDKSNFCCLADHTQS